jgi:hypothetical protein
MTIKVVGAPPPTIPQQKKFVGPPASLSFTQPKKTDYTDHLIPPSKKPLAMPPGFATVPQAQQKVYAQPLPPPEPGDYSNPPWADSVETMAADVIQSHTVVTKEKLGYNKSPPEVISEETTHTKGKLIPESLMHKVNVTGGQTLNTGNYESVKISVSLTIPCAKDEIDDAFEFASSWVSEKIETSIKKAKKDL